MRWFLSPLLEALESRSLPSAWILIHAIRVHLLAPRNALDPAVKYEIRSRNAESDLHQVEYELDLHRLTYSYLTGSTYQDSYLLHTQQQLHQQLDRARSRLVIRTDPGQYAAVYSRIQTALNTLASVERIQSLISPDCSSEDRQHWLQSAESFIQQMQSTTLIYSYEDILSPVLVELMHICQLLHECSPRSPSSSSSSSSGNQIVTFYDQSDAVLDRLCASSTLNLSAIKLIVAYLSEMPRSQSRSNRLKSALNGLVQIWNRLQKHRRQQAADADQMYRYKEWHGGAALDDEQRRQQLHDQLFPSYQDDVSDLLPDINQHPFADDDAPAAAASSPPAIQRIQDTDLMEIFELYLHALSPSERTCTTSCTDADLGRIRTRALLALLNESDSDPEHDPSLWLICSDVMQEQIRDLTELEEAQNQINVSSSGSATATELEPLQVAIAALLRRLRDLLNLDECRGHPTLILCARLCSRLMSLPISSPLLRICTCIEQILAEANKWQQYAAKYVSIENEVKPLWNLVVRWRKMELESWRQALAGRDLAVYRHAIRLWPHLIQLISTYEQHDRLDVFNALDQFVHTASIGELPIRLQMISSLTEICPAHGPVRDLARNLAAFYLNIMERAIRPQFQESRKQIESDLVNLTRMVRWDLANYHALKQSCQKSHNQLVSILDKYDDLLNQPAARYLMEYQERFQRPDLVWIHSIKSDIRDLVPGPVPERRLGRNMLYLMQKSLPDLRPVCEQIRCEAEQILERARELRDGNGSLLRKKKAFTDTMKSMRQAGLHYHQSAIQSCTQIDTTSLEAIMRTSSIPLYEQQFLDLIELMRSVRRAVSCHHTDLTSIEAQRCLGLLEHMFALIISNRTRLGDIAQQMQHLDEWKRNIPQLHHHDDDTCVERLDLGYLASIQDHILLALQYATRVYRNANIHDTIRSQCSHLLEAVRQERDRVEALSSVSHWSISDLEHVQSCLHTLHAVLHLIPNLPFSTAFSNLSQRLDEYLSAPVHESIPMKRDRDVHQLIRCMKILAERIHGLSAPSLDTSWTSIQEYIHDLIPAHHIQRILHHLQHCQWSTATQDQINDIEECLHILYYLHQVQYGDLIDLYRSLISLATCSATILNTIFRQGFCRPVDQKEGDDDGDEVHDGTGMGEGQGHQDVSHEIEHEDQLLGLQSDQQQQLNQDQANEPVPDTEPGMEMENDFQGDMHDVDKNQEQKEDGDEDPDPDDQQPELDRQMSDTDVNNEEVVDERLWDHDLDQDAEQDQKQDQKKKKADANEISAKQDRTDPSQADDQPDEEDGSRAEDHPNRTNEIPDPDHIQDNMDDAEPGPQDPLEDPEDHGGDMGPDNLELPENLNLDDAMQCDLDDAEDAEDMKDGSDIDHDLSDTDDHVDDEDEDANAGADAELPSMQPPDIEPMNNEGMDPDLQAEQIPDLDQDEMSPDDEQLQDQHIGLNNELEAADENQAEIADLPANSNSEMNQDMMEDDTNGDGDQTGSQQVSDNQGQICPMSAGNDGNQPKQQQKKINDPNRNPLRSLADAQEHWKRQCEVLEESLPDSVPDPDPTKHELNDLAQHVSEEMAADGAALAASADPFQVDDQDQEQPISEQDDQVPDPDPTPDNPKDDDPEQNPDQELSPDQTPLIKKQRKRRSQPEAAAHDAEDAARTDDNESEMQMDPSSSSQLHSQILRSSSMGDNTEEPDSEHEHHHVVVQEQQHDRTTGVSEQDERQWQDLCSSTSDLSASLCEQLRIILEPQIASSLGGAFRSGKRLSIRRVISYIASSYRQDRIWLRRCRPSRRSYDITIAIDNSLSMRETGAGTLALQSLTILATALNRLEAGNLSVLKFGADVDLLSRSFTITDGARITSNFSFSESETCFSKVLQTGLDLFDQARQTSALELPHNQLMFIISDARIQQDRPNIARLLRRAALNDQFVVLVVIDSADESASIVNMKTVSYPNGRLQVDDYLTDFPFPFYIILRRSSDLPLVVADALRQWVELVQRRSS